MAVVFIGFYKSIAEVIASYEDSPQSEFKIFSGIQVFPNDTQPYTQETNHITGVELEDATVLVISQCGTELGDITPYFTIDDVFDDNNGIPQIRWSLRGVTTDFGSRLIYLKITQTDGEIFYTNLFSITSDRSNFTTRFDYRASRYDQYSSVRLQIWYRQVKNQDEQNNYDEKSTSFTVTKNVLKRRPKRYFTNRLCNNLFERLADLLIQPYLYVRDDVKSFVPTRSYLFEPFEIPELTADENFADTEFSLSAVLTDVYDPNYVAPTPEPPEIGSEWAITVYGMKTKVFYESETKYRSKIVFEVYPTYNIVNANFCSMKVNGDTVLFEDDEIDVVDGVVTMICNFTYAQYVLNQVTVSDIVIRMGNGVDSVNIVYDGASVLFNEMQINNKIPVLITGTIQAV